MNPWTRTQWKPRPLLWNGIDAVQSIVYVEKVFVLLKLHLWNQDQAINSQPSQIVKKVWPQPGNIIWAFYLCLLKNRPWENFKPVKVLNTESLNFSDKGPFRNDITVGCGVGGFIERWFLVTRGDVGGNPGSGRLTNTADMVPYCWLTLLTWFLTAD